MLVKQRHVVGLAASPLGPDHPHQPVGQEPRAPHVFLSGVAADRTIRKFNLAVGQENRALRPSFVRCSGHLTHELTHAGEAASSKVPLLLL